MVNAKSLGNALPYLACPDCKGELELWKEYKRASGNIEQGTLACSGCDKKYEIANGIVYFFDGLRSTQAKRPVGEIKGDIWRSIGESGTGFLTYFAELASAISEKGASEKDVMAALFSYGEKLMQSVPRDATYQVKCAKILQATSTARYNLENYRGCYVLPDNVLGYLQSELSVSADGVIFDGATATGDNLEKTVDCIGSDDSIGIGIDLSAKMIREAEKKADGKENLFYAQGNLECMPLKDGVAKLISINNALDRLPQPRKVASEIDRISKSGCSSALFNCSPLQFVSPEGAIYVPEEMRMDLVGMTETSGFDVIKAYDVGVLSPWEPNTIFDGQELLPMEGVIGRKRSR